MAKVDLNKMFFEDGYRLGLIRAVEILFQDRFGGMSVGERILLHEKSVEQLELFVLATERVSLARQLNPKEETRPESPSPSADC